MCSAGSGPVRGVARGLRQRGERGFGPSAGSEGRRAGPSGSGPDAGCCWVGFCLFYFYLTSISNSNKV